MEAVSGEGTPDTEAEGTGHLSVVEDGTKVHVLELDKGESLSVNGNDVLAFEPNLEYEINTVSSISGTAAGGLTNVSLTGPGAIALTTHDDYQSRYVRTAVAERES